MVFAVELHEVVLSVSFVNLWAVPMPRAPLVRSGYLYHYIAPSLRNAEYACVPQAATDILIWARVGLRGLGKCGYGARMTAL